MGGAVVFHDGVISVSTAKLIPGLVHFASHPRIPHDPLIRGFAIWVGLSPRVSRFALAAKLPIRGPFRSPIADSWLHKSYIVPTHGFMARVRPLT